MQAVSAKFLATLRSSHTIGLEAFIIPPGSEEEIPAPLVSGDVTADRTASVRRSGSIEIPISTEIEGVDDLRLLAFGGYVRLRRGIRYGDGTKELAEVGYLRIASVTLDAIEGNASLELADRMSQIADEKFFAPFSASGMKGADAILLLHADVFPDVIAFDTTDHDAQPILTDVTYTDRAEAIADLAKTISAEAFYDASGSFCLFPVPTLADPPVWTIDADEEGVLVTISESVDRTSTANGVAIVGQGDASSAPIFAFAPHDDPTSPLRWDGPFGKVLLLEESAGIQDAAQAAQVANDRLDAQLGLGRQLEFSFVPNPALEPGDVVDVVIGGVTERHIIDSITFPLDADGTSSISSRTLLPDALASLHRLRKTYLGDTAWREVRDATVIQG